MPGNINPIFSRVGDVQGSVLMLNAEASYNGSGANNYCVYTADPTNGGFIQRLRFKAAGTNPADVVRIYINNGNGQLVTTTTAPQTPTCVTSTTGGNLPAATWYGKVQALDALGQPSAYSTEISNTTTGTTSSITWGWSAPATITSGVSLYRLFVGVGAAASEQTWYTTTATSFVQTVPFITGQFSGPIGNSSASYTTSFNDNNTFVGELSLPATTLINTAGSVDIDYPLNIALPPGWRVLVGLGTTTANGWICTAIAGRY